jgi:hypothetical protein
VRIVHLVLQLFCVSTLALDELFEHWLDAVLATFPRINNAFGVSIEFIGFVRDVCVCVWPVASLEWTEIRYATLFLSM